MNNKVGTRIIASWKRFRNRKIYQVSRLFLYSLVWKCLLEHWETVHRASLHRLYLHRVFVRPNPSCPPSFVISRNISNFLILLLPTRVSAVIRPRHYIKLYTLTSSLFQALFNYVPSQIALCSHRYRLHKANIGISIQIILNNLLLYYVWKVVGSRCGFFIFVSKPRLIHNKQYTIISCTFFPSLLQQTF